MLVISNIDGGNVEATLHSDSGLYADGQLSGTIGGSDDDPVMTTLSGPLTGSTGGWFYPQAYTTDVELRCRFPERNQIECSYSSSPETDTTSSSPQSGTITLSKGPGGS